MTKRLGRISQLRMYNVPCGINCNIKTLIQALTFSLLGVTKKEIHPTIKVYFQSKELEKNA